ncbi:MAG: hypothetical protein IT577_24675 [Verrucomicrobiae bacterium]|nr:hypothetical protein [Verrucomicrobiae bacterium]
MKARKPPAGRWIPVFAALLCGAWGVATGAEPAAARSAPPTGVRPPYTRPAQPAGLSAKEIAAWRKGWAMYEDRVRLRESLKGASEAQRQAAFQAWDRSHAADLTEMRRLQKEAAPARAARISATAAP